VRKPVDSTRLEQFLGALGKAARTPATIYLVGGASAVMAGWRPTTRDVDIFVEDEGLLRLIPRLKDELATSIELASPPDFVPELPDWRDRSRYLRMEGPLTIRDFDFYSQALAKLERGFDQDRADVRAMVESGLVEPARLLELFDAVADQFYRYPAVDPAGLRLAVERLTPE
jgi:hypothetical protein